MIETATREHETNYVMPSIVSTRASSEKDTKTWFSLATPAQGQGQTQEIGMNQVETKFEAKRK